METLPCCREYSSSETPAFPQEKQSKNKTKRFPQAWEQDRHNTKCRRNRFTTGYPLFVINGQREWVGEDALPPGAGRQRAPPPSVKAAVSQQRVVGMRKGAPSGARRSVVALLRASRASRTRSGNFGAPGRRASTPDPGTPSDAPRRLSAEGEATAWRGRPGGSMGSHLRKAGAHLRAPRRRLVPGPKCSPPSFFNDFFLPVDLASGTP